MNNWLLIFCIAAGTFVIRLSFFELWAGKQPSAWLKKVLQYVPPAVVAAIVFPLCVATPVIDTFGWPQFDLNRVFAGVAALLVGILIKRNMVWPMLAGMSVLWGLQWLVG